MASSRWLLMVPALLAVLLSALHCEARNIERFDRSIEQEDLPDINDNEVLPEAEVARAHSGVVQVQAADKSTTTTPSPPELAKTSPETSSASPSSPVTSDSEQSNPTEAPNSRPFGGFSRFLSDLIQIPIAVMRSVGALLSNTFQPHSGAAVSAPAIGETLGKVPADVVSVDGPTTTPAPAQPAKP